MKSLLFSLDHVYKQDGTLTPVELNTNTGTELPIGDLTVDNFLQITDGYYNHSELHTFLQDSSITKIKTISVKGNDTFFKVFAQYYGYSYELIETDFDDISIPEVSDADDTIIIRIAYDTYALIDDLYARDNYEFLNLIKSESFASKVTFLQEGLDTIDTFNPSQEGITPNYVVKHRTPGYIESDWPKLYRLNTQEELDILKSSLSNEEYIQKFECNISSSFIDNRITFLRSENLVIGETLDSVINLCNYISPNRLAINNELIIDPQPINPESNRLSVLESAKFYPTFYVRKASNYHHDETDLVLTPDNSLLDFDYIESGSILKDIKFSDNLTTGFSGSIEDLNEFVISSSSISGITSNTYGNIFVNITGSLINGEELSWFDGVDNRFLVQSTVNTGSVEYKTGGDLKISDKVFIYDNDNTELVPVFITSKSYQFKPITTYLISLDPNSEFFVNLSGSLFLIQHNACFSACYQGTCTSTCNDCGKNSNGCINCGGASTTTCFAK